MQQQLWKISQSIVPGTIKAPTAEQKRFIKVVYCLLEKQETNEELVRLLKDKFLPSATDTEVYTPKNQFAIMQVFLDEKSDDCWKRVSCSHLPLLDALNS